MVATHSGRLPGTDFGEDCIQREAFGFVKAWHCAVDDFRLRNAGPFKDIQFVRGAVFKSWLRITISVLVFSKDAYFIFTVLALVAYRFFAYPKTVPQPGGYCFFLRFFQLAAAAGAANAVANDVHILNVYQHQRQCYAGAFAA